MKILKSPEDQSFEMDIIIITIRDEARKDFWGLDLGDFPILGIFPLNVVVFQR